MASRDRFKFFPKIDANGLTHSASEPFIYSPAPASSIAAQRLRKVDKNFDAKILMEVITAHRECKEKFKARTQAETSMLSSAEARLALITKTTFLGEGWSRDKEIRRLRRSEKWTPSRAKAKELDIIHSIEGLQEVRYKEALLVMRDRRDRQTEKEKNKRLLEAAREAKMIEEETRRHLEQMDQANAENDEDDEGMHATEKARRERLLNLADLDLQNLTDKNKDCTDYEKVMTNTQRERLLHVERLFTYIAQEKNYKQRKVERQRRNVVIAEGDIVAWDTRRKERVRALFRNFSKAFVIWLMILTLVRRKRQQLAANEKKILLAFRDDEEKRQSDQDRRRKHADAIARYHQRLEEEERQRAWMAELQERERKKLNKRLRRQLRQKFKALEKKRQKTRLGNMVLKLVGVRNFANISGLLRPCIAIQIGYIAPALPVLTYYSKQISGLAGQTGDWVQLNQTFHFPIKNADMQHLSFSVVNKPTKKDMMAEMRRFGLLPEVEEPKPMLGPPVRVGVPDADGPTDRPMSAARFAAAVKVETPEEKAAKEAAVAAQKEADEAEAKKEKEDEENQKPGQVFESALTHLSMFESDIKIQLHLLREQRLGALEKEVDLNYNKRIQQGEIIELYPPVKEEADEDENESDDEDEDGNPKPKPEGTEAKKKRKKDKKSKKEAAAAAVEVAPVRVQLKDKKHDGSIHFELRLIPVFGPKQVGKRQEEDEEEEADAINHLRAPIHLRLLTKHQIMSYSRANLRRFDAPGLLGT